MSANTYLNIFRSDMTLNEIWNRLFEIRRPFQAEALKFMCKIHPEHYKGVVQRLQYM